MASRPTRAKVRLDKRFVSKCASQKAGYPTKQHALDAAERLMEQGRVDPGCHLTPYQCDECTDWHIYNRQIVSVGLGWKGR